jgi:predicted DNA-binding protein with PD1-like motif
VNPKIPAALGVAGPIHNLRLHPKDDLRLALSAFCKSESISAGVLLSGVGSLSQACLRFAQAEQGVRLPGPFEIVSITGTLSMAGMHVHLSIADSAGKTWGGHLLEGNFIFTTCELVIMEQKGVQFLRELDPQSGYRELVIKPQN